MWHIPFLLSEYGCETLMWESQQGRLLCSYNPTALAVWLLQVEWGATKVVSYCCIDRYSNYILLHSVPISVQHQHTPLKLHYTLAKWNKSQHSMVLALKKRHWPLLGLDIKSCHGLIGCRLWLLIYGLRVWCRITCWIILMLARVHLKALTPALTGHFKFNCLYFYDCVAL